MNPVVSIPYSSPKTTGSAIETARPPYLPMFLAVRKSNIAFSASGQVASVKP
jgi:hypothetical protein